MMTWSRFIGVSLVMLMLAGITHAKKDEGPTEVTGISYYKLDPKIITNVKSDSPTRAGYVQVKIHIMGADSNTKEALEHHTPYVRDIIITELGQHSKSKLRSPVGQAQVRRKLTRQLQQFMEREREEVSVENVLITEIVVE